MPIVIISCIWIYLYQSILMLIGVKRRRDGAVYLISLYVYLSHRIFSTPPALRDSRSPHLDPAFVRGPGTREGCKIKCGVEEFGKWQYIACRYATECQLWHSSLPIFALFLIGERGGCLA